MVLIRRGFLIAAAFTAAAIVLLSLCLSSVAAGLSSPAIFTVVLDAGHGGVDTGVLGVQTKVKESDLNLMIVRELQEDFENAGFAVVLTRTDEGGLYGLPTEGFKKRDMQKRKEIIESAAPPVCPSPLPDGAESVTVRRLAEGKYAADILFSGESGEATLIFRSGGEERRVEATYGTPSLRIWGRYASCDGYMQKTGTRIAYAVEGNLPKGTVYSFVLNGQNICLIYMQTCYLICFDACLNNCELV